MHNLYLKQTLALAESRRGFCAPNPAVGAVVVKNNQVISSGSHFASGHPHAEVEALKSLGDNATGATLYSSLEPCCHRNKKTPPCTDLIIQSGIKKVVYAFRDPNPEVAGKGEQALQQAEIDCQHHPISEITDFYQSYQHWCQTQKPFVTAKIAMSLDGKIAGANGERITITGDLAQHFTHEQRYKSDAILTTAKTIIADDPLFNIRLDNQVVSKPLYILDRELNTPLNAKIFQTAKSVTLFYDKTLSDQKIQKYEIHGAQCVAISANDKQLSLAEVLQWLGKTGVHDLWVEAGGICFSAFAREKMLNAAYLYLAPKILGNAAQSAFFEKIDLFDNANYQWKFLGNDIICKINWV